MQKRIYFGMTRIDPSSDTTLQLPVTPGGLAPPSLGASAVDYDGLWLIQIIATIFTPIIIILIILIILVILLLIIIIIIIVFIIIFIIIIIIAMIIIIISIIKVIIYNS